MKIEQTERVESARASEPVLKTWIVPVLESMAGADGVLDGGSAVSDGGGRSSGTAS